MRITIELDPVTGLVSAVSTPVRALTEEASTALPTGAGLDAGVCAGLGAAGAIASGASNGSPSAYRLEGLNAGPPMI